MSIEWRAHWRIWLLLAVPFLLPFGRSAEAPVLIGALCGLIAIAKRRIEWKAATTRLALVLFAAYWLPELISAFDSVAPKKTWQEVGIDLRFLPFLLFATTAARNAREASLLTGGVAAIVAFWCIDALLQAATGFSLGGAATQDRLSGIFGADDLKLGGALAVLSPFALSWCMQRGGMRWTLLAALPLVLVVLLAGARAGWVGFTLGALLVLWHRLDTRRALSAFGALLLATVVAATAGYHLSDKFAQRVDRTAALLGGDEAALDHALSGRLPIWATALRMAQAHPINGVGVRGFRYDYPEHAAADDPWIDPQTRQGAMHAHQIVLELASETGLIGVFAWFAAAVFAWRDWRRAASGARDAARPAAFALVVMLFPFNTHYAMYSAVWGLFLFALLALWLAAQCGGNRAAPANRA